MRRDVYYWKCDRPLLGCFHDGRVIARALAGLLADEAPVAL
jgi:hypothetical protein